MCHGPSSLVGINPLSGLPILKVNNVFVILGMLYGGALGVEWMKAP